MGVIILIAIVVLVAMAVMNKIADSMMDRTRRQVAIGRQVQAGVVVLVAIIAVVIYSQTQKKEPPRSLPSPFDGIDLSKKTDPFPGLTSSAVGPKSSPERFGGIGVVLTKKEGSGEVIIDSCLNQGPAMKEGLAKGDVITAIDLMSVVGKSLDDVVALERGSPGTTVIFTIQRNGEGKKIFAIKRVLIQAVNTPSIPSVTPKRAK
jgi:S1-C subfamily serine protease